MRSQTWMCVLVGLGGTSGVARANHVPAPPRPTPAASDASHQARLELSTSSFTLADHEGQYWTLAAIGRMRLMHAVGAQVRVPVHMLSAEGGLGSGIGDVGIGGDLALGSFAGLRPIVGVDIQLPSGDSDRGFGYGTAAIGPYITVARTFGPSWRLSTAVAASVNTSPRDPDTLIFIEHRADLETRTSASATWMGRNFQVSGALRAVVPLAPEEAYGNVYLTASPAVAYRIDNHLSLAAFAEIPISSQRQLDWRTGLSVVYTRARIESSARPMEAAQTARFRSQPGLPPANAFMRY